jgi:hypothetical protein
VLSSSARPGGMARDKVVRADQPILTDNRGPLKHIAKLTHATGPLLRQQPFPGWRRQCQDPTTDRLAEFAMKLSASTMMSSRRSRRRGIRMSKTFTREACDDFLAGAGFTVQARRRIGRGHTLAPP